MGRKEEEGGVEGEEEGNDLNVSKAMRGVEGLEESEA